MLRQVLPDITNNSKGVKLSCTGSVQLEVLEFFEQLALPYQKVRQSLEFVFMNGCCFQFALLLHKAFPDSKIYGSAVTKDDQALDEIIALTDMLEWDHFSVKIGTSWYDAKGELHRDEFDGTELSEFLKQFDGEPGCSVQTSESIYKELTEEDIERKLSLDLYSEEIDERLTKGIHAITAPAVVPAPVSPIKYVLEAKTFKLAEDAKIKSRFYLYTSVYDGVAIDLSLITAESDIVMESYNNTTTLPDFSKIREVTVRLKIGRICNQSTLYRLLQDDLVLPAPPKVKMFTKDKWFGKVSPEAKLAYENEVKRFDAYTPKLHNTIIEAESDALALRTFLINSWRALYPEREVAEDIVKLGINTKPKGQRE